MTARGASSVGGVYACCRVPICVGIVKFLPISSFGDEAPALIITARRQDIEALPLENGTTPPSIRRSFSSIPLSTLLLQLQSSATMSTCWIASAGRCLQNATAQTARIGWRSQRRRLGDVQITRTGRPIIRVQGGRYGRTAVDGQHVDRWLTTLPTGRRSVDTRQRSSELQDSWEGTSSTGSVRLNQGAALCKRQELRVYSVTRMYRRRPLPRRDG